MSTNPKTKAYQERINKLASELAGRSYIDHVYIEAPRGQTPQERILWTLENFDPGSTREMQAEAIKRAVAENARMIRYHEQWAEMVRKGLEALETVPWYRRLKVVEGGKNDAA